MRHGMGVPWVETHGYQRSSLRDAESWLALEYRGLKPTAIGVRRYAARKAGLCFAKPRHPATGPLAGEPCFAMQNTATRAAAGEFLVYRLAGLAELRSRASWQTLAWCVLER